MGLFPERAAGGFPTVMRAPGPVAASGLGLDSALSFTFLPEKLQPRVGVAATVARRGCGQ